ncbi:STAS domain-containing protein [Candidatus Pelagibacter communis]|uniref:STAS domain-containing protein n=1 Tax=Pelagibacter ubique TaxID=198252 RepID=UPI00065B429C|nr:STAS domain-containing protein [Candidatus Pelagibacter ubique]
MSIEQKIEGNIGKLFLSGEIDLDGSPEVRENIKDLIDKVNVIEVQLSKVNYIDSSGIAALVEGMQLSKSNSKEFSLTDVSNEVMKVIKLAHLDKIFKIKNVTGANAAEASSDPEPVQEPEPQASENVDLSPNEETQAQPKESEPENNQTEETSPSIKRDDDDGDKIKFKR